MKKLLVLCLSALCLFAIFVGQSNAIPVRGSFAGEIDISSGVNGFTEMVGIGAKVEGVFSYDTGDPSLYETDDMVIHGPGASNYVSYTIYGTDDVYSITAFIGGGIGVTNDAEWNGADFLSLLFIEGFTGGIGTYSPDEAHVDVVDSTGAMFDDTSLPTTLSFNDCTSGGFWIANYGDPEKYFELHGVLTDFSIHPVPEPSTILLLACGLIFFPFLGKFTDESVKLL